MQSTDDTMEGNLTKLVAVTFAIEWTAITHHFDFDVDLDPHVLCDAVAREPWSREFFNNLRAYVFSCCYFAAVRPFWYF